MSNKYTDILPNTSMLLANSLNQETHLFLNQINKNSSMLLRFPLKIATQISQSQTLKNITIKHINNNLRIGDIVLMRYSFKSKDSTSTECILYPEKIVSNQMYCIPFNKLEEIGGDKSIFKRSLFRIENPQHSFFQYQYKQMKNIIKTSNLDNKNKKQNTVIQDEEKKLKHLQTLADEERKGNSSEFLLNYNNDVAYGQIIQFRNVFTGELLVVDMANISKEIGCLDVILNPLGGQTAWFKLIPSHRIRNEGECVSYCDDFYIQATCIESAAFMHVIHHDDDNNNNNHRIRGMEITISCRKSIFMLSLFESAEEIKRDKSKGILKSTSVIKLYNTDYEGYLHASVKNGQIYMQKPKTEKRLHNPRYMVQYNSTNNPNHILQTNNATSNIGNTNSNAAHYRYISSITVPFQNMNQKEEDTGNISVVGDDLLQNSNSNEGIIDRDTNKNINNLSNHSIEGEDNLADDLEYGNVEEEMDNPIALAVKRASTYVVTLDQNVKELNCNTYWEVQYEKIFEGKNISFGIPIRLRHVPSGFYLSFNSDSSEITLSQAADDQTLFFICPDKQQQIHMNDNIIMNKNQVYFLAKDSEAFLKVHEVNMDNNQTQYGLVLSKDDKIDYAKMVFKIEIQNDILVKVNYNVALTVHHLKLLYDDINAWGIRILLGDEIKRGYVYDYFLAVEGESKFEEMINAYKSVLIGYREIETQSGTFYKTIQNFNCDQGIILILLKFIILLDSKSTVSQIGNNNNNNNIIKDNIKGKSSPEAVAAKYTKSAIDLSFETIKLFINDNAHCSQALYMYINLINELFDYHKLQVIEMLIICLKNTNKKNSDFLLSHQNLNKANPINNNNNSNSSSNVYLEINFWKTKITELNEKQCNLLEQKLYIQVLAMLCLDSEGNGIFVNQMEVKIKMFEIDLFPLKFGMDGSNHSYVIFPTKLSNDIFFQNNPTLYELSQIKGNFRENILLFYYDSFSSKYSAYIDYISAVLDFYYAACVSRNQMNIHIISNGKIVGLTVAHIWQVIDDCNIPMAIRMRYLKLFRVLYIDTEPYLRISQYRFKIFKWNSEPKENEDLIDYIYKWFQNNTNSSNYNYNSNSNNVDIDIRNKNDDNNNNNNNHFKWSDNKNKFDFLCVYIKNFFKKRLNAEQIINFVSFEDLSRNKNEFLNLLSYIKEIFILTKEMIDFGYFNSSDLNEFLVAFAYFFSVFEKYNSNIYKGKKTDIHNSNDNNNNDNRGDINISKSNLTKSSNQRNEYIRNILDNSTVGILKEEESIDSKNIHDKHLFRDKHWLAELAHKCMHSEFKEVKAELFILYETCIDILNTICVIKDDLQIYSFLVRFKKFYLECGSLTDSNDPLKIYNHISEMFNVLDFEIKDFDGDESSINSSKEQNVIPLDIYLLGILFYDYDDGNNRSLDHKALTLLIKYFGEFNHLKKQLSKLELIVNEKDLNIFNSLIIVNHRILAIKQLLLRDYVTYSITQNTEKQGNLNRLQDLKRNIEMELISKLEMKHNNKKLCKIQNICRHLKIHTTLIELMNFLMKYDPKLPIYNSIFKFLYYFCYKNYQNQVCLKQYFDPFLSIVSKYEYVSQVLTEIVTLFKETSKINIYIQKIFTKITSENDINPEVIDILRSLTQNYDERSLTLNQSTIFQNFLSHTNFKGGIFSDEELKELDQMILIVRKRVTNSLSTYKIILSKIKLIQLLSACSYENSFWVLHFRRLVKIENMVQFLISQEIPYKLKPASLAFFKNVFYPSSNTVESFPIDNIFKVIKLLVLPELHIFYFFASYFVDNKISKSGMDVNRLSDSEKGQILQLKDITLRKIKTDPVVKELLTIDIIDLKLLEVHSIFGCKKFLSEQKKLEYMRFLLCENTNYNIQQEGMLIFIGDVFKYIYESNVNLTIQQKGLINKVKEKLNDILDYLTIVEEKLGSDSKITDLEVVIQKSLIFASKRTYTNNNIVTNNNNNVNNVNNNKESLLPLKTEDVLHLKDNNEMKNNNDNDTNCIDNEETRIITDKEQKNAIKILKLTYDSLCEKELSLTSIFNLQETDIDKEIDKFQFKRNLKLFLNNKANNNEIEDTLNYIDTNQDGLISLKDLSIKLKQISKEIPNKKKRKIADYQDINFFFDLESQIDDQSHKITNVFKHFILSFHEIQIKATKDQEFSEIVYKLNTFLIKNNQTDFIKRFLACLKGSFQKKKHKIFLIKIMSELITSKIIQVDNNQHQHHHHHDKYIHVSEIQNQLNNAGVTEFVLSLIEKNKTKNVIEESLNLLILLLKNGNRQVQKTIFNYLSSNPNNTFKFTSYVREVLHSEINKLKLKLNIKEYETTDIDLNKTNNIFSSSSSSLSPHNTNNNDIINFNQDDYLYELTTNQIEGRIFIKDENQYYRIPYKILFLLKLCCENCYEPFQHFLREQDHLKKHTESLSSINIVYEIGNLIINLLNFGDIIYSDHETIQLINQGFVTLTELCVGPCRENQILLGSRRMMFKMINNLLKRNYNFNIKEETQCKKNLLLCRAISFLKTLLNHETFIEYSSILLDELDIYLLVEKLMDIYHTIIYPNIDYLYAGKLCKHVDDFKYVFKRNLIISSNIYKDKAARNCNNNLCNNNYITYIDQRYIKMGFDIFIILSYIKDAFPKHPKIFWFNYNSSNQISLNAFGKAELDEMNKQHKYKENKYKSKQHKRQKLHILQTKQTKKSVRSFQQQQQHKSNDVIGLNMKSDKGSDVDESDKSRVSYLSSYSKLNSDKDNNNNNNKSKNVHKKSKSKCCNCYFKKHKFIPKLLLYNYSKDNTKLKTNRTRIWKDNMKILETKFSDKDKNERDLTKRFINKYIDTFNECYLFYAKNISNVEILYRGEVVKTYFRIPYLFKYLENETKHEIIWESQSDNYQERLEELFKKISQVKMDLNYQQKLGVYRNIINKWPLLNAISFIISITINLILFFFVRNADEEYYDTEQNIYVFVNLHPTFDYYFKYNIIPSLLKILEFIQLALNIITIIFLFIHKYPVITFKLDKKADAVNLSLSERKIKKYSGSLLYNFLYEFIDKVNTTKQHFWIRIYKTFGIKMLLYPDFVILLIYLSVSICSLLVTPFFQIGLLFDILRRNKYLLIIFKAMKLNFFQIMSMLLLLLVILYIFATFEFFSLRQHFRSVDYMQTDPNEVDINSYCDNIYSCLFSVILIGLTSDNGLSIIGGEMSRNYKDYWKKYLIDVTFYLIVLVFVMNIILSLMIDSFRVLRDKIKANEKNIKEYCYVCGIPKYVFEIKGNGWMSHYKYEHNIFAYLYYIVELESKEKNECNGLEKYVKSCLEKEDYSFLPLNQSRILKDKKKKMATTNSTYGVNGNVNVNSNHNGSFSFNSEDYWKSIG